MFVSALKSLVLIFSTFLATTALVIADPITTPAPNQYVLHGDKLHITYSTTGVDGKPHFSYQDKTQSLEFSGDQIRTVGTEIGTLVSVTTLMTVDTGSTSFSVLLPRVNLDSTLQAGIRTEGVGVQHKFSIIPEFNRGQLDVYTYTRLYGNRQLRELLAGVPKPIRVMSSDKARMGRAKRNASNICGGGGKSLAMDLE